MSEPLDAAVSGTAGGAAAPPEDDYVPQPRKKREDADFDITPMIDVVFLLLIFFMVSSTMQEPTNADPPPAQNGLQVAADGSIRVTLLPETEAGYEVELPDGRTLPLEEALETDEITKAVAAVKEANPGSTDAVLLADRDATAEQTFPILRQMGEVEGLSTHNEVRDPR